MAELYPSESQNLDIFGHLEELRRRLLICLSVLAVMSIFAFMRGQDLMWLITKPAKGLVNDLIFITPTEVFISYVKVSFLAGFIASFPVLLHQGWMFLSPAVSKDKGRYVILWMVLAVVSFVVGILFSYFVAVPAALTFLIQFGKGIAVANISIGKYISFITAFILIGGTVFEIPIIIGLLSDIGLVHSRMLKAKRSYAVLIILIVAAVITPTQDIANLLVFSVPMILLYEIGIIISMLIEKKKNRK